jgi:hypothetical protein
MKILRAKYPGRCKGCGGEIKVGDRIAWAPGTAYHINCKPSSDRKADQEYWRGRQEGAEYSMNRRLYGDELAEAWEIEREMKEGW